MELARTASVTKRFGSVVAVEGASVSFASGEIHAVCGENGAGKSTLLKLVAGLLVPDAGEVSIDGRPLTPATAREAIGRGVAIVLQHFALVPGFSVLENLVLGAEPMRRGVLDLDTARARAARVMGELGASLPLDAPVDELGIGDRQRLEIARALFREARLVILDEPTAVLAKSEAVTLYGTLRRLAEAGRGVVVVTHKMDEVREHADVVTVMRRGRVLFSRRLARAGDVGAEVDLVARAIMGTHEGDAPASTEERRAPAKDGAVLLAAREVTLGRALRGISLEVRAGEVVGVAGVEGNGQRELVALFAGDVAPEAGEVVGGPVVVVREDRHAEGLVLDASLEDNLVLGELSRFERGLGVLDARAVTAEARTRLARSGVSGRGLGDAARTLSGGNQQKIVLARALARDDAKVLVAAQPTRGVDLGAAREIRARLSAVAASGRGVLVLSSDLDELRAISTRIVVLARGRIVAEVGPDENDQVIGQRMLGLEAAS